MFGGGLPIGSGGPDGVAACATGSGAGDGAGCGGCSTTGCGVAVSRETGCGCNEYWSVDFSFFWSSPDNHDAQLHAMTRLLTYPKLLAFLVRLSLNIACKDVARVTLSRCIAEW